MRYDINKHIKAFLSEDRDNKKGCYHNANWEQVISRQLLSYIMFRTNRRGKSIQAWIKYALQNFLGKTQEDSTRFTGNCWRFYESNPGLKFTPRHCNRS
mmetsp:Transcript_20892/g.42999  ORF Transcript_20892/g.42999 Transcript_20892/m.42999 type:complete len:99 (-) Transcript_20892:224-520(-)